MLHLSLQDNIDSLGEFKNIGDGARIQIVIAPREGPSTTYVFRLNANKRTPNAGGFVYEIDGYLDVSNYWHSSSKESFKGTSYKAIQNIANICGLAFNGDQTADSQLWLPRNIRYHEWARMICERGYRSDTSCMQLGLNFDKTLTYRDISFERPRVKILNYGQYRNGTVLITDIQPMSSSGSMNHHSGYSSMVVEQDLLATNPNIINKNVEVTKEKGAKSLLVNSKVKSAVPRSRVEFAPLDVGNCHSAYEKALYQNNRINNLFSSRLAVVTPEATGLKLLDKVTVALDKTTSYFGAYSGDYLLGTRVIRIQANEYFEKLELLRKSVNSDVTDAL